MVKLTRSALGTEPRGRRAAEVFQINLTVAYEKNQLRNGIVVLDSKKD